MLFSKFFKTLHFNLVLRNSTCPISSWNQHIPEIFNLKNTSWKFNLKINFGIGFLVGSLSSLVNSWHSWQPTRRRFETPHRNYPKSMSRIDSNFLGKVSSTWIQVERWTRKSQVERCLEKSTGQPKDYAPNVFKVNLQLSTWIQLEIIDSQMFLSNVFNLKFNLKLGNAEIGTRGQHSLGYFKTITCHHFRRRNFRRTFPGSHSTSHSKLFPNSHGSSHVSHETDVGWEHDDSELRAKCTCIWR